MTKLIHAHVLNLPPICPIYYSKPFPKCFDSNALCQYHHQLGHDTKKCYGLKNYI